MRNELALLVRVLKTRSTLACWQVFQQQRLLAKQQDMQREFQTKLISYLTKDKGASKRLLDFRTSLRHPPHPAPVPPSRSLPLTRSDPATACLAPLSWRRNIGVCKWQECRGVQAECRGVQVAGMEGRASGIMWALV